MFTHLPTKLGLPSVRWPPIRKSGGYLDRRKMESVYIFLYKGSNVPICKVGVFCYTTAILARCPYLPAVTCMSVRQKQTQVCRVKIHHHKGYSFDYSCSTTMTRTMILVWKNQKHFTCNIWAPKQVCNLSSTWSVLKNASTLWPYIFKYQLHQMIYQEQCWHFAYSDMACVQPAPSSDTTCTSGRHCRTDLAEAV